MGWWMEEPGEKGSGLEWNSLLPSHLTLWGQVLYKDLGMLMCPPPKSLQAEREMAPEVKFQPLCCGS